ncbi:MAG TPA: hypothetical protein VFT62_00550, partial [Mycobacteriales bacterium]|nr:hypothetical protein [Mycobacteriales bacterium]
MTAASGLAVRPPAGRTITGLVLATHPLPSVAVTAFFTATALAAGVGARAAVLAAAVLVGQA